MYTTNVAAAGSSSTWRCIFVLNVKKFAANSAFVRMRSRHFIADFVWIRALRTRLNKISSNARSTLSAPSASQCFKLLLTTAKVKRDFTTTRAASVSGKPTRLVSNQR